mmetsp:Transcript_17844/g.51341  ORF Transcript_17844/g.51341 Transcript_17844/m.51341 type:complete len:206 (+) Transcript_17844:194-811(+)
MFGGFLLDFRLQWHRCCCRLRERSGALGRGTSRECLGCRRLLRAPRAGACRRVLLPHGAGRGVLVGGSRGACHRRAPPRAEARADARALGRPRRLAACREHPGDIVGCKVRGDRQEEHLPHNEFQLAVAHITLQEKVLHLPLLLAVSRQRRGDTRHVQALGELEAGVGRLVLGDHLLGRDGRRLVKDVAARGVLGHPGQQSLQCG